MDKNLYKFGLDWLNGVLPVSDVWEVFQELEKFSSKLRFDRWELVNKGMYNYNRRFMLDGKATIQLMYNPVSDEELFTADMNHNNSGVFFSISGDGIRYLHSLGGDISALNRLLFYFHWNSFRCSRFDVYCDILDKKNTAVPIIQKAFNYFQFPQVGKPTLRTNVQRKASNVSLYKGYDSFGKPYTNCVLGNHGTRFGMFRCYNKREEVLNGRLNGFSLQMMQEYGVTDYWWRLEYEIHKENADVCFKAIFDSLYKKVKDKNPSEVNLETVPLSFEDIFASAMERVFDIVDVSGLHCASSNYPVSDKWYTFCTLVNEECIHLVQFAPVPYIPMSKSRLHSYIRKNSVFVYSMLVALFLDNKFARLVVDEGSEKFLKKKKYNGLRDELEVPPWMNQFVNTQFNRADRTIEKW